MQITQFNEPSATPSGLDSLDDLPQGSRGRQPWAVFCNPFGVEPHHLTTQYSAHFPFVPGQMAAQPEMVEARHSALSTQHSALSTQHSALGLSTQHFLCNPK